MLKHHHKSFKYILQSTLCLLLAIIISNPASAALSDTLLDEFNINGIYYYNPSGTGSGYGCYTGSISLAGNTAEEKIWAGLTSFMTPEQAAGVMGNMAHEGNYFNPLQHEVSQMNKYWGSRDIINDSSIPYGIGLIQWSYDRRVRMLRYVQENAPELLDYFLHPEQYSIGYSINGNKLISIIGESAYDSLIKVELEFLQKELLDNPNGYGKLLEKGSVQDAADFFLEKVEKPADISGNRPIRRQSAQKYYDMFNGVLLSPSGGCSGGILVSGGMTYDEAYSFIKNYVDDPNECSSWSNICSIYEKEHGKGEPGANCVTFVQYFLNKYTSLGLISPMGNGGDVVSNLINNHGLIDGGTTPAPYAVFSTRSPKWSSALCGKIRCGHTGIVLGIDKDAGKIYIGQMAYGSRKTWGLSRIEYNLEEYSNGDFTYAYTDNFLKI